LVWNSSAVRGSREIGYYDGRDLIFVASVRAGLPSKFRRLLPPHLENFQIDRCPFANLPDRGEGLWGEGLTAAKMSACRWGEPFLVAGIEFLEWTPENRLRHPRFTGLRSDKDARDVAHE
jgi:ATP-dependent DNA ligase